MTKAHSKSTRREIPHVALLIETSLSSGRDILMGISRFMRTHGRWSVFHQPRELSEPFPAWLRAWRGDGIIARIQNQRMAKLVAAMKIPAVDVLGVFRHPKIPLVHVDDHAIGRSVADHLLTRGFRQFGVFGIEKENWAQSRRDAFRNTVIASGHDCRIYEIPRLRLQQMPWEQQEHDLVRWLSEIPKPAGIMVSTDDCGLMLVEACRRSGIRVPDEVAVVGVSNDVIACELTSPPLSSVNCNLPQVGFEAAALLDRLMAGKRPPSAPLLIKPLGVVTRLSSDVVAVDDPHVRTAVRFIREHACEDIDVNQIIKHVPMSRSVLQRRFRMLLNRSVHDEIIRCRLQKAIGLLSESDLAIAQIAEYTGFKYQQYMNEVFKKYLGESPAMLRLRTKLNNPSGRVKTTMVK